MPGRSCVALTVLISSRCRAERQQTPHKSQIQFADSRRQPEGATRGTTRGTLGNVAIPTRNTSITAASRDGQSRRRSGNSCSWLGLGGALFGAVGHDFFDFLGAAGSLLLSSS